MLFSPMASTWLVALGAMLWGSDLLLRPEALSAGWSPAKLVLGEHLLLTLVFLTPLWRGRRFLSRLNAGDWGALFFVSWGGSAVATWLYTLSFTLGPPLTAILLQKTQPLFALLGAGIFLGERRQKGFWTWCLLALGGAWLLTGIEHLPSLHNMRAQQAICALGAAALWGGATVAGRKLSGALPPIVLTGARFALATPLLAGMALLLPSATAHSSAENSPVHALLFLLLIVLLPDLLGMGLYYWGLRCVTASAATLAELCYPLTALLIGVFVQHTHLAIGQWTGFILLTAAVLGLSAAPRAVIAPEQRVL